MSIFLEWIALKGKERNDCRNRIGVILFGWSRLRKERDCHSFCVLTMECYGSVWLYLVVSFLAVVSIKLLGIT